MMSYFSLRLSKLRRWVAALTTACCALLPAAHANSNLLITEIQSDGLSDFWELTNVGTAPINIGGYKWTDSARSAAVAIAIPAGATIAAGESVVLSSPGGATVLDTVTFAGQDDEAIIAELTDIRGIGRWTAEMFLIFNLLRPNVLPLDDLGLLRAVSLHYLDGEAITGRAGRARVESLATGWAPWRSVATWYLWRSLDPVPVEY